MSTVKKDIRGSQTEKNIVAAYLAESSAYTRYTFYAKQAQKELYIPVQLVFEETAANELHHSKVFFKMLQGGNVTVPMSADAGVIGDTVSNLECAAHEEWTEGVEMYRNSAATAREEGFDDIASHFEAIASIEEHHRMRYDRYIKHIKDGTLWKRDKPIRWRCTVCGYIFEGTEPPLVCPACNHPRQHYIAIDSDI